MAKAKGKREVFLVTYDGTGPKATARAIGDALFGFLVAYISDRTWVVTMTREDLETALGFVEIGNDDAFLVVKVKSVIRHGGIGADYERGLDDLTE